MAKRESPCLEQQFPCLFQAGPSQHQQLVRGRVKQKIPELRKGRWLKPLLCAVTKPAYPTPPPPQPNGLQPQIYI